MPKTSKKSKNYKKPPIVEAVIEVRFTGSLNEQQLKKLVSQQKTKFSIHKIEQTEVIVSNKENSEPQVETKKSLVGYKLIDNADSSNIIQIKQNAISVSRLPPYESWAELIETFKKYYDLYTQKKFSTISRIGVRYINRIDIPTSEGKLIKLEDYFKIFPKVPETKFPALNRFLVQTIAALDKNRVLTVNVQSANETPLLNHVSIIFDVDVAQLANLPVTTSKLYELLGEMGDKKNSLFEDLLTPKCKKLFN
ncbi:MAG: TIGR04255 family protein [Pseudomonadota bacterium]